MALDDRIRALARYNFRLFWGMVIDLDRMPAEVQVKHLALAEEQLRWMENQGWLKPEVKL
jgi:hypothetical protein